MFALGIRYLNGWAMATHPADRNRAEWPPHPDRVFMALAAAHFETDGDKEERAALEWLEKQGEERYDEPRVTASDCLLREVVTSFVPVNDDVSPFEDEKKGKLAQPIQGIGIRRKRRPRSFPIAIPDDPVVFLLWPGATPTKCHLAAMETLCAKVTSIGHSASLVQMWVESTSQSARWEPQDAVVSELRLRVPYHGRLAELEQCFNKKSVDEFAAIEHELQKAKGKRKTELRKIKKERFGNEPPRALRPVSRLWKGYVSVAKPSPEGDIACSAFDRNLLILRRVTGPRLGLESTLQLTEALRDTVMTRCGVQPPPEWISGHTADGSPSQKPHLAFIPLPHVDHTHADGHLLGAAIAVPRDVPTEEQRHLGDVLFDDQGLSCELEIRMGRVGVWKMQFDEGEDTRSTLQTETWTTGRDGAKRWATATPVVFDRHPKKPDDAEETLAAACQRVGLPRPKDVILTSVSMFIGVPHARRFPLMQRKTGGNLHHTHAILTFDQPIVGPMLLGAGRYRGYGLCRPLRTGGDV